jgi:hypothetical protein
MIRLTEFKMMNIAGELEVYVPIIITSKAEYTEPVGA